MLYTNTAFSAGANELVGNVSLVDLRTQKIRVLLDGPAQETNAVFSPDGRWISYISNDSGRAEAYVQAFQGGEEPGLQGERIRLSTQGALYVRWRGDGREIAYLGADGMLYGVTIEMGRGLRAGVPRPLFRVPVSSRAVLPSMYGFDVSADGSRFLLPTTTAASHLVVIHNWQSLIARKSPRDKAYNPPMHVIRFHAPAPALRRYIRNYANRYASLPQSTVVHPIPARATHVVECTFGDPYTVVDLTRGTADRARPIVAIGMQTHRRVELTIQGTVDGFSIFFEPTSFRELFSVPVLELTNRDEDAHAVIGREMSHLREILGNCGSFEERVQATDEHFISRARNAVNPDPLALAVCAVQHAGGCSRIDTIASAAGISMRQFQRRFAEYVGVSPKLFARIVRFESALERKWTAPHLSWTDIAQEFGYHDQMHMVHDFRQLSGEAPTQMFAKLSTLFLPGTQRAGIA